MAKSKMRTSSLQLPIKVWDYIKYQASIRPEKMSMSAMAKRLIMHGLSFYTMLDIMAITAETLVDVHDIIYTEFEKYFKQIHEISFNERNDMSEYFTNNPNELEKAKKFIYHFFAELGEDGMLYVLNRGDLI